MRYVRRIFMATYHTGARLTRKKKREGALPVLRFLVSRFGGDAILDESEEFLGEEINPLIAAVLPGAFEVFISSRDRKIADLIYEVHKLWATVEILTDMNIEWFSKYLEKYGIRFENKEDARMKVLSFVGAIGNICGHYANGGESDQNKVLYYMLSYMGAILGIPVIDMDGMISRLNEILERSSIRFREETGV